jgi:hypothetical protein
MRWTLACIALTLAAAPVPVKPKAPKTGVELLGRMHDRYAGKWYTTLTFVQRTTNPGRPVSTWYEAAALPGRLRIDIAPIDSGNAFMFIGDSTYSFSHGQLRGARQDRNLLLTLGFDVYGQPVATTVAQLEAEQIDLSKVRADKWEGKPVWVVGATAGDTTSNQFWVEQDRLLFVRLIQQTSGRGGSATMDARFNRYQRLGGGWLAINVVAMRNGKTIQEEDYTEMHANVPLGDSLWDTQTYHRPGWVK